MSGHAALTELILEVFRLNGHLLAAGDALVRDLELTSARWQVIGLSRQNVQRIANELESQGVLQFEPNPHHRRAKLVLLTEHGRALYDAAAKRQRPWANALANGLPIASVEAARDLLRTLRRRLENDAGVDDEP